MRFTKATECQWAEEQIHRLLIDRLSRRQRARLARHLMRCRACRRYFRDAKRLPGLLATVGPIRPPDGLCEYIQAACAVSSQLPDLPAERRVPAVQLSLAGVAATVVVAISLAVLRPLGWYAAPGASAPAASSGLRAPAAVATPPATPTSEYTRPDHAVASAEAPRVDRSPAIAVSALAVRPPERSRQGRTANGLRTASKRRIAARRLAVPHRPAVDPAPSARAPAGPRMVTSPVEPAIAYVPASVVAAPQAPARVSVRSTVTDVPGSVADSPERAAEAAPAEMNEAVAAHLAAGMVASALIERYLADAIAERGAELATENVSTEADTVAVVSDAVLAHDELGEP